MMAPSAAPPPTFVAVSLPRDFPFSAYVVLTSEYDFPRCSRRTNSRVSSLCPVIFPADLALARRTNTSAPLGTTTSSPTTIGASSEAWNTSPALFTDESTPSIMRIEIVVPAATSTGRACGGGGGGGGAGAAAACAGGGSCCAGVGDCMGGADCIVFDAICAFSWLDA